MGICLSTEGKQQALRTQQINKELERERDANDSLIKLLLLGAGDSGKSTILKQMKIIHAQGFSSYEIETKKGVVYANTINAMFSMLKAMPNLGITLDDQQKEVQAQTIYKVVETEAQSEPFTRQVYEALKVLWIDEGVRAAYKRRNEYTLEDSAKYFLDSLDRTSGPDYSPSETDILYTRVTTQGIVEVKFTMKEYDFHVCDVGGQRSERRKWIHCFSDVNAIVFVTSLSEYDQALAEDSNTNRMVESLTLFESICNSEFFLKTAMIVFLNKRDIFETKIKTSPITLVFENYKGPQEFEASADFIEDEFKAKNFNETRRIYTYRTCAIDTNQVEMVLDTTIDIIIEHNMRSKGMI